MEFFLLLGALFIDIILPAALLIYVIICVVLAFRGKDSDVALRSRLKALQTAKMYLSPYQDIWRNLKLSNKHCSLELTKDKIIIAKEKDAINGVNREFIIIATEVYSFDELWNMF